MSYFLYDRFRNKGVNIILKENGIVLKKAFYSWDDIVSVIEKVYLGEYGQTLSQSLCFKTRDNSSFSIYSSDVPMTWDEFRGILLCYVPESLRQQLVLLYDDEGLNDKLCSKDSPMVIYEQPLSWFWPSLIGG